MYVIGISDLGGSGCGVYMSIFVCVFLRPYEPFSGWNWTLKVQLLFIVGGGGGGGSGVRTKIYNENYCHLCFSRGLDPDLRSPVSSPCPKTDSV